MNSLAQRSVRYLPRLIQLLPPALNLLPRPLEAAIYWSSAAVLFASSTMVTAFTYSKHVGIWVGQYDGPIEISSVIVPDLASLFLWIPGLALFVVSQVFSHAYRPWLLIVSLVASHFVFGGPVFVLLGSILILRLRRRSSALGEPN